jgi:hypothetical protein
MPAANEETLHTSTLYPFECSRNPMPVWMGICTCRVSCWSARPAIRISESVLFEPTMMTTRVILLLGWRGRTMPLESPARASARMHPCAFLSLLFASASSSASPGNRKRNPHPKTLPHHDHRTFEGNALTINLDVHIMKQFSSLW